VRTPPGPSISGPEELTAGARALRASTSRAIVGAFGGNLLEMGQFFLPHGQIPHDAWPPNPSVCIAFLTPHGDSLRNLEIFLGAVGDVHRHYFFSATIWARKQPANSPRMYREFFKPRHAMLWARAKQLANVKVMLHSCGAVRPLLPDLIDAGLDAINPVQISCRGMEAEGLSATFGRDLTFWGGGCDTQNILPQGTPAQVREHVLHQCETLAPSGGFVFQRCTTSWLTCPPKISSPCTTRCMSTMRGR